MTILDWFCKHGIHLKSKRGGMFLWDEYIYFCENCGTNLGGSNNIFAKCDRNNKMMKDEPKRV